MAYKKGSPEWLSTRDALDMIGRKDKRDYHPLLKFIVPHEVKSGSKIYRFWLKADIKNHMEDFKKYYEENMKLPGTKAIIKSASTKKKEEKTEAPSAPLISMGDANAILELVEERFKSFSKNIEDLEEEVKGIQANLRGLHAKIREEGESIKGEFGDELEKVGEDYKKLNLKVGQAWNRINKITLQLRPRIKKEGQDEKPTGNPDLFTEEKGELK